MTEAQERFLRAIADRVAPATIAELHLFPAIRQGGYETGIAVIAAEPSEVAVTTAPADLADAERTVAAEPIAAAPGRTEAGPDANAGPDTTDDTQPATPYEQSPLPDEPTAFESEESRHRLIVLSARYRLTLKGVDRGKWDVEVLAQADAPLVTVDAVVRGVQRRAGDAGEPERLTGEALRALLDEWSCTATTR